jgi:hypothetical protein
MAQEAYDNWFRFFKEVCGSIDLPHPYSDWGIPETLLTVNESDRNVPFVVKQAFMALYNKNIINKLKERKITVEFTHDMGRILRKRCTWNTTKKKCSCGMYSINEDSFYYSTVPFDVDLITDFSGYYWYHEEEITVPLADIPFLGTL